ncbi:hypothetical protein ZPAH1_orf00346 [Aeromonas phage ZPAH1]|nr:hypothetical protein ASwh1_300 [Aeromonas phage Aswh_1]QQG34108.1 hypothetical protein ZPAH1_orf00346 [Aeromonas phage ZPAH1]
MVSTTRLTKVKLRIQEEKNKIGSTALHSWGLFFIVAAIASVFASTMYPPIVLGSIALALFQWFQLEQLTKERVGILGKAYSNPICLLFIESAMDGEKDIEGSITKWEDLTEDDRKVKNKVLNFLFVAALVTVIVLVSLLFCGVYWILPV